MDLEKMILPRFGIDIFGAKSGIDEDVCVLSFQIKNQYAAKDLSKFLEKEGNWILDADVSTGENYDKNYLTFVELKRNRSLHIRILDLIELIEKLCGHLDWTFSVGKQPTVFKLTSETLEKAVPDSPKKYLARKEEIRLGEMQDFFNQSPFNNVMLKENDLVLQQYFQPHQVHSSLSFNVLSEDPSEKDLAESAYDPLNNNKATWLSKMLGPDIVVEQSGSNFVLTNTSLNKSLLVSLNV